MIVCKSYSPVSISCILGIQSDRIKEKTYTVLLLLHVQLGAILKGPVDDVGIVAGALDELTRLEGRPEVAKVLDYLTGFERNKG